MALVVLLAGALCHGPGFAADSVTLEDIRFQVGGAAYRLPRVEFVGANLERKQLSKLFDASVPEPLPARLAALSAAAVNIPEVIVQWSAGEDRQVATITGVSLQNVVAGKAARVSVAGVRSEGAAIALVSIATIAATDVNVAAAAEAYAAGRSADKRMAGDLVGALDLGAIDIRTKNGSTLHVDRFSISGMRALPGADPDDDASAASAQRYLAGVATVAVAGVNADIAGGEAISDRLVVSIKSASFSAERPYDGLPTDLAAAIDDFEIALPETSEAAGVHDLRDMGFEALHGSLQLAGSWNEAASQMVGDATLRVRDAGSIALRATVGNVTKEAFSSTPAIAEAARSKATWNAFAVSVRNGGLFEKLVANEARKQNRSPDAIRADFMVQSAAAIVSLLGALPDAVVIGRAVVDFIRRPGEIEVVVKSKDRNGVTWADLVAAAAVPAGLADKLTVTAHAK
jgi:hypothetical protein